jgi:hypothetical protein
MKLLLLFSLILLANAWKFPWMKRSERPLRLISDTSTDVGTLPYGMTARTSMTEAEARVLNDRYQNEDVIWDAPKCLLCGNIVGAKVPQKPNLYPDQSSTYMVANITMGEGWMLTFTGRYPNARYFCITIAKQLGNGQTGNGHYLRADQIVPDKGSTNPHLPSNRRDIINRYYTVYIKQGFPPNIVESNTLYTYTTGENERIHVSTRTYLADIGYDGTGNVKLNGTGSGLVNVTLSLPYGENITGPKLIDILRVSKGGDPNGYTKEEWFSDVNKTGDLVNAPCLDEPFFQVFWNTAYSVTGGFYVGDPEYRVKTYPPSSDGGFATNNDTRYMISAYSFDFGMVVVVSGKMPTHWVTRHGQTVLVNNTQLQYFSVSTAAGPASGEGYDTLTDEQIPVKNGRYTIVISWPWNRPDNAITENGVGYLNPGAGEGHYVGARNWIGLIYIRFQAINPDWKQGPNNIPIPTISNPVPQDAYVMESYYPMIRYTSKAEFELHNTV